MTTKKAYETENLQKVTCDAMKSGNKKLEDLLDKAWWACEEIDKYCEWSDNDVSNTLDALREDGQNELADELAYELAKVYGEEEVEVVDNWQDEWRYCW